MQLRWTGRPMALAVLLCLATAMPAGAYFESLNTGTTADYTFYDEPGKPGATCVFENNAGTAKDELDRIKVRTFFSHAPFAQKSYVGYRFIVKRQAPPFSGAFKTVYTSPILRKRANDAEVAYFPARTWTAPEGATGRYRVQILLFWYAKGSQSTVIGRARGLVEVYNHRLGTTGSTYEKGTPGDAGFCDRNYHGL